jgi:hypothetical protein
MIDITCGPVTIALDGVDETLVHYLASLFFWNVHSGCGKATWVVSISRHSPILPRTTPVPVAVEFGEEGLLYSKRPRVIAIQSTGGLITIDATTRSATIFNSSPRGRFVDTYRLIRQLIVHDLMAAGFICLHASTLSRRGQGWAFVGEKGAGKTSLVSHLSSLHGYDVVSNDKLFLRADGSAVHFPEAPAVTVQTLLTLPDLHTRLEAVATLSPRACDMFLDHPPVPPFKELLNLQAQHKVFFSEQEFLMLLGAQGATATSLRGVAWLDNQRGNSCIITPLDCLDLMRCHDPLDVFHDWTGLRETLRKSTLWNFKGQFVHIGPATKIEETVTTIAFFLNQCI